uniref:Serine/threonine-protein kinase TOR n=1 Tax=Dunaliella tertiolecta TaxID=3047 RepID=A0A7S3R516_DUNTE|mmetsp:Transcript_26320/g.67914  ORF Transcript_26320/g.67914 Transcript_26320/m.67914 type:complete len:2681 (+) Transcript_26320:191-8233(+)
MSVADWLQRSLGSGSSKREGALDGLVGMRSSAGISSSSWKATDNVGRLLEELCRPGVLERRKDGERHLLQYIDAEARNLSSETFSKFIQDINRRVEALLRKEQDVLKRLGGVLAIDELIDIKTVGDDANKTKRLWEMLSPALEYADDITLIETMARTMGRLVKSGGAMASDIVDLEVNRALSWCDPKDSTEAKRLAAVMLLREMAEQAPAVFNVHVKAFIDAIWCPLRDTRVFIREAAVQALKACLCLVEMRETRYRVQWYYKLFVQTMRGLNKDIRTGYMPSAEAIHGSLLALGELLQHTGEFLLARYKEVVETVLCFKDSKEKQIRRAVMVLLPRLAAFSPERFAAEYLGRALTYLIAVLKNQPERGAAFSAIAAMSAALADVGCASAFEACLPAISTQMKESIGLAKLKSRVSCPEALECAGVLARALGPVWRPHAAQLLEGIMLTGLSEVQVNALIEIAQALPELLEDIQLQLLDLLSLALAKRPFNQFTPPSKVQALNAALTTGEVQGNALIKLALQTLSTFDFGHVQLLEFTRDHILVYTDDADKEIRQAAVLACCKVLERFVSSLQLREANAASAAAAAAGLALPPATPPPLLGSTLSVRAVKVVEKVAHRLMAAAVADPSERVRVTVLAALQGTTALDEFLGQADFLRSIFIALNDESCQVRALTIQLVGRLSSFNPAYVNPALRRHLLQLLTDMEHSPDSKLREDAAYLLDCLITAAPSLILPYVSPIHKSLVAKLRGVSGGAMSGAATVASTSTMLAQQQHSRHVRTHSGAMLLGAQGALAKDGSAKTLAGTAMKGARGEPAASTEVGVARTVLATIGQLAVVSGCSFKPYVSDVLPLVIEAIQDAATPDKRIVAVTALGQIVESTGTVMKPYMDFPQLLSLLLRILHEGSPQQRKEVMKVLGIVGALDPHTHKVNQASLSGEGKLEKEGVRPLRGGVGPAAPVDALGVDQEQGRGRGDDTDLLPASGLVTSSEDYYPTVAINALMRVLRDPAMATQHMKVIEALMTIFRSLSLAAVPYLPKVMPVLLNIMNSTDEALSVQLLCEMENLVKYVRQHMRRFLPDLLALVHSHWGTATACCLNLLRELSTSLRDDFKAYVPELLPKFVALITEAERTQNYSNLGRALGALEALGSAVTEHVHLVLHALTRLINPAQSATPVETRRLAIRSMRKLLPRMELGGYASAVLHPLMKVLDGPHDELRREALDTICVCAVLMGTDFALFVPIIRKAVIRHHMKHEWFERLAHASYGVKPPCMSDAEDWESTSAWASEVDSLMAEQTTAPVPATDPGMVTKYGVNAMALKRAWESSQRVTKEDWAEWMRHFSVELLRESPSPALRACHSLALVHPSMARELFAAGFVSCWSELDENLQHQLVRSLEAALASPTIPPEIVTSLLNLAEFMEHDDKQLPLDTRTLGALAEKCHAFAKALHYKEMEFQASPQTAIEALIHINNQLRQPEAAVGVLTYAQKNLHMELKESWYEKLCRWDEALAAYESRLSREVPGSHEYYSALLGKMRCLASLAEWDVLSGLCKVEWGKSEPHMRREMAMISAHAAWHMGLWDDMSIYVDTVDPPDGPPGSQTPTGAFLRAVLSARSSRFEVARLHVERARELMSTEFAALVGESYERAYTDMVRVQQLTELEEVVEFKAALERQGGGSAGAEAGLQRTAFIKQLWRDRLRGAQRHVEVWQSLFSIRQLVIPMHEDTSAWLKFASLCRKSGRVRQAHRMLLQLLRYDPLAIKEPGVPGYGAGSKQPDAMLAFLKHCYIHISRQQALARLKDMVSELQEPACLQDQEQGAQVAAAAGARAAVAALSQPAHAGVSPFQVIPPSLMPQTPEAEAYAANAQAVAAAAAAANPTAAALAGLRPVAGVVGAPAAAIAPDGTPSVAAVTAAATGAPTSGRAEWATASLPARAFLRLGMWQWAMDDRLEGGDAVISSILTALRVATATSSSWSKAWHQWALFNVAVMQHYYTHGEADRALAHVAPAVRGFFRSVALGQAVGDRTGNLQDILRLLTLWFNHGSYADVEAALQEGFSLVSIDTWLVVIPQVIARIHTANSTVRQLIHQLLVKIGKHHPQALMYPLLVATKSQSPGRRNAAFAVLDQIRQHSPSLVEQAQLVSHELIRMAILWHEMWHEGLEEASRLYFGESNVEGMLATLLPLHDMVRHSGASTLKEIAFVQSYGRELDEAYEWLCKFRLSRKEAELHQAWDLYYHVFKRINKQLHSMNTLELQYVAPALVRAQGMELAVPGTYIAGEPLVTIAAFAPQLHVISSKQRPRKLTIHGGDGAEYMFLLKGHEDLRQDERVMQLFGLVNNMLANDRATAERDLSIARYAVIPLSPNSGLIGWVPNCDTLHALIREFREGRKVPLNLEHRLMLGMAPDYDHLTVIQKVEVFEHALDNSSGQDLHKVLWLKSRSSEVWLDRRTNYTRSAAVMSMVGYILGLGDRHPSNLMLDRYSGKLLHIDFGDCFEASMHRDKFPEKVPFRLTRMMVKAMEVAGIEGNFRTTCENVMRVLRSNKESVTAMLEAFVHDPLINWRLLNTADATQEIVRGSTEHGGAPEAATVSGLEAAEGLHDGQMPSPPRREARERELREAYQQMGAGDANEVLNSRAVAVMTRMSDKLMGRDYTVDGMSPPSENDSVVAQVQRLIAQATSHENLCQSYIGWCPFW